MRNDLGAGGSSDHGRVATGMVAVFMAVQQLRNLPATHVCQRQAFFVIQRINREGSTGFRAGNQVIKIAVGIASPDAFNNQAFLSSPLLNIILMCVT